jgi:protein O-GlcNAc transferase
MPSPAIAVKDLLQTGFNIYQAGNVAQAETAYRHVLASEPGNLTALHMLGLIALDQGRAEAAIVSFTDWHFAR